MPRIMFDSDNPQVLLDARCEGSLIATYADLITPAIVTAAGPRLVVIDRGHGDPHNLATVVDVERGLLSIADGVAKLRQWSAEGRRDLAAYHDRNTEPAFTQAAIGLHYVRWIATLDGTADFNGQYPAAVQCIPAAWLGFHADASVVWNDQWHPTGGRLTSQQFSQLHALAANVQGALGHLGTAIDQLQ